MHLHSAEQVEQFRIQLVGQTDREILAMFSAPEEYSSDALRLARLELIRRQVPLDEADRNEAAGRERIALRVAVADPESIYSDSYVERHWDGALSLARAYWINCVVVNLALGLLIAVLSSLGQSLPLLGSSLLIIMLWSLMVVITIWQFAGTWRSATRQIAEGLGVFWPRLARVAIILGTIAAIARVSLVATPQVSGLFNILRGDPEYPATKVTVLPSGHEVEFRGGIRMGSAAKLAAILEATPAARVVYLDTPGGRVAEAEAMAKIIWHRHLSTYVENQCASAGVLVFLGGVNRTLRIGAEIGVHSASFPGSTPAQANRVTVAHFRAAGASKEFIAKVVATSPSSIWVPSLDILKKEGIVTNATYGRDFPLGSAKLADLSDLRLAKALDGVPLYGAVGAREPRRYADTISLIVHHLRHGETMVDALRELRVLIDDTKAKYRPYASAEALDLYLKFLSSVLAANKQAAPDEALQFVQADMAVATWRRPDLLSKLPHFPQKAEDAYLTVMYSDPSDLNHFDREKAEREFWWIESIAQRGSLAGADSAKACEIWEEYLGLVQTLPRPVRTNIARFFITRRDTW